MPHRVLDVGNCAPDHAAMTRFLRSHFDVAVEQAHDADGALAALRSGTFALVLVNRKLDADYSDGIEVVRRIKSDPQLAATPVMLVTNLPEHQQLAIAEGALPGFGKLEFDKPETLDRLRNALGQ